MKRRHQTSMATAERMVANNWGFVDKKPIPVSWDGSSVVFGPVSDYQLPTVTHPLAIGTVHEKIQGAEYAEHGRGNTIVDISPPGKWIPLSRLELDTEQVPY